MYGLVLEGGGSKGSYQIGACKALNELGIEIGSVAGTSVGALNGAMVVQGDVDLAYSLWDSINPDSIIKMPGNELEDYVGNEFQPGTLKTFIYKIRRIIAEGGLNVEPLVQLARSVLDEDRIRKSPIGFGIVTVDVTARKAVEIYKEEIPKGQLLDYVIASASFPAFKRAVIDGRVFIDGGFYNVLPINMVSCKGYNDIIVLRTYGVGLRKRFDTSGLNIISISPAESLGPTLDFSTRTSRKNLKMGYYDVYKVFRKLRGRKYYIMPMRNDSFFIHYLANLSEERLRKICGIFGTSPEKRVLFEEIIPKIAGLLDLSAKASYEDIAIRLLEKAAEGLGIERFRIYSVEELYDQVLSSNTGHIHDPGNELPRFFRSREHISGFDRERILTNIAQVLFMKEESK